MVQDYTVKQVDWHKHLDVLRGIRTSVFVEEQHVPLAEEWDGRDVDAIHVLAVTLDNQPIGTARLLPSGQIGRMAVLRDFRQCGVGGAMLRLLLSIARERNFCDVFLNSQMDAVDFYRRYGFIETGEIFMEAGIRHRKMTLSKPSGSPPR